MRFKDGKSLVQRSRSGGAVIRAGGEGFPNIFRHQLQMDSFALEKLGCCHSSIPGWP